MFVSDIAVFVLKRDVKLQPTSMEDVGRDMAKLLLFAVCVTINIFVPNCPA